MVKRFLPWMMVLALASGASADEHAEEVSDEKPVRYVEIDAGWRARVPEEQRKLLDGLSDSKRATLNELHEKLKNDSERFDDILKHALTLEADQRTDTSPNPIRPSLYLDWALRGLSDENDKAGRRLLGPLLGENEGKGGITEMDVDKEYNLVRLRLPKKELGKDVTATYITGRDSKVVEAGGKVFCLVKHPDKPFEWAAIPLKDLVRPELAKKDPAEFKRLNDLTGKIRDAEETAAGLFLINDNKPAPKAYNDPFRSPTPRKEGGVRMTDAPDPTPRLRTKPEPAPPPARTPEPAPQPSPSRRYWVSTPRESASPLVQLVRPSRESGAPRYFINWENRPTYVNPAQPWYGGGWSYYPNWSWGSSGAYPYWY